MGGACAQRCAQRRLALPGGPGLVTTRRSIRTEIQTPPAWRAGVVLFWRGVWNTFDILFGSSLYSQLASMVLGLAVMMGVRLTNVPLATSLPGG